MLPFSRPSCYFKTRPPSCALGTSFYTVSEGRDLMTYVSDNYTSYSAPSPLRDNDMAQFGWFYPYPGDWHMLKLISEIIRDLLWDGGLKQFCIKCGIESDLTQWQDIHIMLLTCYEYLLEFSVAKFQSLLENSTRDYWEWVHSAHFENNMNEIGRFWAQILVTLHFYTGFYISIRSGN